MNLVSTNKFIDSAAFDRDILVIQETISVKHHSVIQNIFSYFTEFEKHKIVQISLLGTAKGAFSRKSESHFFIFRHKTPNNDQ